MFLTICKLQLFIVFPYQNTYSFCIMCIYYSEQTFSLLISNLLFIIFEKQVLNLSPIFFLLNVPPFECMAIQKLTFFLDPLQKHGFIFLIAHQKMRANATIVSHGPMITDACVPLTKLWVHVLYLKKYLFSFLCICLFVFASFYWLILL